MRHPLLLLCVLIGSYFLPPAAFAQQTEKEKPVPQEKSEKASKKIDKAPVMIENDYSSYKKQYSPNSLERVLKEARDLKQKDPAQALDKVEEALGMSLAQNDRPHEAQCYILLAEINEAINEWKLALDNYQTAFNTLNALPEPPRSLLQQTHAGLGNCYLKLGRYDLAEEAYQQALKLATTTADKNNYYLSLSEVYLQRGQYDEALLTLDSIALNRKKYDPSLQTMVQNQAAKTYARRNELDKTRQLYSNSISSLRHKKLAPEEEQSLRATQEAIADAYHEQQLYDDEIEVLNEAIDLHLENENFAEVAKDRVAIGNSLAAKGESRAALRALERAASFADSVNTPEQKADALLALANLYDQYGQPSDALSTYKRYSEAVAEANEVRQADLDNRSALLKKQRDIEEVTKNVSVGRQEATLQQAIVFRQQLIIYGLLALLGIIAVASYFIYKNARASKRANQLLALKSLRSQMNPHFIFNALNSVNQFIAEQDERTANRFLSEFSQLMRLVLENSQQDFIPLQKEQEILALYLKLEHYRFRDKFDYTITVDEDLPTEAMQVPPMLIQPYIENAVWHGLRYKENRGTLSLHFQRKGNQLLVRITDNGIGRKQSAALKTEHQKKHRSTGLKNIEERLKIINHVYQKSYRVTVADIDAAAGGGTQVQIYLPLDQHHDHAL